MLLQTAHTFGEQNLVAQCLGYIEAHCDAVIASPNFLDSALSAEVLCQVLQVRHPAPHPATPGQPMAIGPRDVLQGTHPEVIRAI